MTKLNGYLPHIVQLVTTIIGLWLLLDKVPSKSDLVPLETSIVTLTSKVNTLEATVLAHTKKQ